MPSSEAQSRERFTGFGLLVVVVVVVVLAAWAVVVAGASAALVSTLLWTAARAMRICTSSSISSQNLSPSSPVMKP